MTGLDVYYDVARSQTEEQDKRRLHFDTMAVGAFGLAGVLIGVVAFTVDNWASWSLWPFSGALVTYVVTAGCALKELWLREWKRQPPLKDLRSHILDPERSDADLVSWTAKQLSDAVCENENHLALSARWLTWAYRALAAHIVLIGILIASAATTGVSRGPELLGVSGAL